MFSQQQSTLDATDTVKHIHQSAADDSTDQATPSVTAHPIACDASSPAAIIGDAYPAGRGESDMKSSSSQLINNSESPATDSEKDVEADQDESIQDSQVDGADRNVASYDAHEETAAAKSEITAISTQDDQVHEIADILDWRYTETESKVHPRLAKKGACNKAPPAAAAASTAQAQAPASNLPMTIPTVELLVYWKGFPDAKDYTYEDEGTLQLTAPQKVWDFWSRESNRGANSQAAGQQRQHHSTMVRYPRNMVLGIDNIDEGVPLRIVRHRKKRRDSGDTSTPRPAKKAKRSGKTQAEANTTKQSYSGQSHASQASIEYQVEWVGYSTKTWEPAEHLDETLIRAYEEAQ